ncbi:hypothetical protein V8B97DRAFT_2010040 [Scleroderma yunnanense]
MKVLTIFQGNRARVEVKRVRGTIVGVKTVKKHSTGPGIKALTSCQGNRTRVKMKTLRRHSVAPAMKSLTDWQGNRTRVDVKIVRRHNWTWH